ncbi:siphovirus Gp157 family protein, partial [Melissococcus plutonius]|uniref:siphovirus Gp157 family protein n=1 Tax=Melissococcus plutonius TaxID=33970 RepID=UPI0021E613D0
NDIDPKKVINSMFIFNKKRDGTHKARFVARGDIQHPDTYDSDMQSNTVHHYALMTSLSLALDNNYYITKFRTPLFSFGIQNNTPKVEITDESLIPEEFIKTETKIDKKAIKAVGNVPGVKIVQTESLRIR